MKQFKLFTTFLMVVLCAILVTSCSQDDESNKEKELKSLIIGKWQVIGDDGVPEEDGMEFKSNGRWKDDPFDSSSPDSGIFWIKSEALYMQYGFSDEDKPMIWDIKKLDSKEMILVELEGDWAGESTLFIRIN